MNWNQIFDHDRVCRRRTWTMSVLLTTAVLCGTVRADLLFGYPEAELFAADVGGQLRPPQDLIQRIHDDLAAIRRDFPLMSRISYRPGYVPNELRVHFAATDRTSIEAGLDSLAQLNEDLGVIDAHPVIYSSFTSSNHARLKFEPVYNLELLSQIYEQQPQVTRVWTNWLIGGGNSISVNNDVYTFTVGWGDCPSGCISHQSWKFRVENGRVTPLFQGPVEWPDTSPFLVLPIAPEPSTITVLAVSSLMLLRRRVRS